MVRRVLVLGATGFVGRHVAAELTRRGDLVARCDIALGWDALSIFRQGDAGRIQHYDLIVHAAAAAPHRMAIDTQPRTHLYNQLLDAAMFDWAVTTGQGRVIYLSSSAAYPIDLQRGINVTGLGESRPRFAGSGGPLAEDEIDLAACREPDSAYGWTKLTGERLAASARAAGLDVTVLRTFSGYGEDQSGDFPFRALIERARRREDPSPIWGDGNQVRDWIHISDVVAGMLAVAESGTTDPVNLCTGVGTSMLELAEMACAEVGYSPRFEFRTDKPAGVAVRVGDPSNLHTYYKPQVTLADGVRRALGSQR